MSYNRDPLRKETEMNNKAIIGATFILTAVNTGAIVFGAKYAMKKIEEAETEVEMTKKSVNKTIKQFGNILAQFEVWKLLAPNTGF